MATEEMGELLKQHRWGRVRRILVAIALVCALALFLWVQYKNRVFTEMSDVAVANRHAITGTADVIVGTNLVTFGNDGAACMDSKGKALWNQTYEMQNPMMANCGKTIAFADYNGREVYVMNDEKILGDFTTNMPIRRICVSENGVILTVQEDTKVTWIYLYDATGKELVYFSTRMQNTGYPTALSLSPDAKLVSVGYTYPESGALKSRVAFYNFGDVGENEIDHLVSGYNYSDTFVPYVQFMNKSTAFALADNRFMIYSGSEVPEVKKEWLLDKEVLAVHYSEDYVGLIFYNEGTDAMYRIKVYNTSGDEVLSLPLPFTGIADVKVVFDENSLTLYNEKSMYVYDMSGRQKYEGSFDRSVRVLKSGAKHFQYILATTDSFETVELK